MVSRPDLKRIFSCFSSHKRYLPSPLLAVFILLFFYVNATAHEVDLQYDISADFKVNQAILNGRANLKLPAEHGMKFLVSGLTDLKVKINGEEGKISPTENLLSIPPEDVERKITLSWKTESKGNGSSLISPGGIVLLGNWYPKPAADAQYSLTVTIPADFSAISEADRINSTQRGGKKEVNFHFPHSVAYIHFIAGPYQVEEEEFRDGKILASYFFKEDQELAADYRTKAKGYLGRYIEMFGDYPYGRFSVVENRWPTGFAMPTFTLLGQQIVRLPFIIDTSLGHEVLHSWLGNAVGIDAPQGNWVEGMATYLADHAYAVDEGEGVSYRKNQLVKYQNYVDDNNTLTVQEFTNPGSHDVVDKTVRAVGYNKTSMIFHMLRRRVGEDDFRTALRNFYQNNKFERAGWQEIENSFSEVSGQDLSLFFRQWLTRSDVPNLKIKNLNFQEADGDPLLSFDIVQENSKPYNLAIPIRVETKNGSLSRLVKVESDITPVSLELSDYPVKMVVDPGYDLMRSLAEAEFPPVWSAFLGAENKLVVVEKGKRDLYTPIIEMTEALGGRVVDNETLKDEEMKENSLLFLGEDSQACRSIFGEVNLPGNGFSLEVRKNPLNLEETAVIVQAADRGEVEAVAGKLSHYGKYGVLSFQNGKNITKSISESNQGIVFNLDKTPAGIALSEPRNFEVIFDKMAENRIIYVGETHVRVADHQLQMRIIRALHKRHPEMAIGMEMFPATVQETIDRFIRGELDERQFIKEVDYFKNWGYDYRYYQDIMQFARKNNIPVLGLNLDREIVSSTFRKGGIAALDEEVKKNLPGSLDLSMEGYRERLGDIFRQHQGPHFQEGMMAGFVQAQALWDETMAEKVADYLHDNPNSKMVVLAGSGHVNKKTGIPPRVNRRLKVTQCVALNSRGDEKPGSDEGDYLFFTSPFRMEESPMLGVRLRNEEEGLTIAGFTGGHSRARETGLKKNDVILSLDGREIKEIEDIKIVLLYKNRGDTVTVKVKRPVFLFPDSEKEIKVRL